MVKIGLVVFPGSNCDRDVFNVLNNILKLETEYLWHKTDFIHEFDAIILPGGFSYGDRLRAGIIAARSPIVRQVKKLAERGLPVLGICNGFQILVESGMLPGALLMNRGLNFVCKWTRMEVLNTSTPFTGMLNNNQLINIPVAHGEGRYVIDQDTYESLKKNKQIVFKYKDENPNGSIGSIAGVCNVNGNVLGMMPHPERASDQILMPRGLTNNAILIFQSLMLFLSRKKPVNKRRG
jgi:phosphoribosylformylglycinamidine synthase subunit PurQ / glutaminase